MHIVYFIYIIFFSSHTKLTKRNIPNTLTACNFHLCIHIKIFFPKLLFRGCFIILSYCSLVFLRNKVTEMYVELRTGAKIKNKDNYK